MKNKAARLRLEFDLHELAEGIDSNKRVKERVSLHLSVAFEGNKHSDCGEFVKTFQNGSWNYVRTDLFSPVGLYEFKRSATTVAMRLNIIQDLCLAGILVWLKTIHLRLITSAMRRLGTDGKWSAVDSEFVLSIDHLGVLIIVAALVVFLFAIVDRVRNRDWKVAPVLCTFVLAGTLLFSLIWP